MKHVCILKAAVTDFFSVHAVVKYSFIQIFDSFQMCTFSYAASYVTFFSGTEGGDIRKILHVFCLALSTYIVVRTLRISVFNKSQKFCFFNTVDLSITA